MQEYITFDDVLLKPQTSVLRHRSEADLSTPFTTDMSMDIPIVSAAMESVTGNKMAFAMAKAGGGAFRYRGCATNYIVATVGNAVKQDDWDELYRLAVANIQVVYLNAAHADSIHYYRWVEKVKETYQFQIVAGDIATASSASRLVGLGVNGITVGIGPGAACLTRSVTGFGMPQLSAIMEVSDVCDVHYVPVIANGGIRNSGDIVKAIAAGASSVMLGSLLAGCDESPYPGRYWGEASYRMNGHHAPEGDEGEVRRTGTVDETLKPLLWGLRSGVSYSGFRSVREMRGKGEFIRVSPATQRETEVRFE